MEKFVRIVRKIVFIVLILQVVIPVLINILKMNFLSVRNVYHPVSCVHLTLPVPYAINKGSSPLIVPHVKETTLCSIISVTQTVLSDIIRIDLIISVLFVMKLVLLARILPLFALYVPNLSSFQEVNVWDVKNSMEWNRIPYNHKGYVENDVEMEYYQEIQ